jgi:glycosyltransferase involved in cell wall biosynthesis
MPKVTILMAVYNGERYLREAIESILGQSLHDFEFLIINDGSTDSSREVILSYDDPRIRLVDNTRNLGQTRSLNRGLELAEGQFIARQDADDISGPERLAKQVAFLETHTEVALLGTCYTEIDVQGTLIADIPLPCDCTQIRWCLLFFCPFVHSSVMLRKSSVLGQIGFYNETFSYGEDYELWSRIARCLPVANLRESLVQYRITPWSKTATYGTIVDDAIQRIRVANIGHLLDRSRNKKELSNEVTNMNSLLLDTWIYPRPEEAIRATEMILRLHYAFCQYYGIGRTDCRTYRADLCSRMSRRLIDIAHHYYDQDRYAARQLLLEACRLHWSILLAKSFTELSLKLLMGPHLVGVIRHLIRKETN